MSLKNLKRKDGCIYPNYKKCQINITCLIVHSDNDKIFIFDIN